MRSERFATNLKKKEFIDILDVSDFYPSTKYHIFYAKKGGITNPVVGTAKTLLEAKRKATAFKRKVWN